jgi:hypothetical protein
MRSAPIVADLDTARLDRFATERAGLVAKLAALDERERTFCRQWSGRNGYRVYLTPDQVRRSIEGRRGG